MDEFISKILKNRKDFLNFLQKDLEKNKLLIEKTENNIKKLKESVNSVKTLKQKPEHASLIPLSKRIYFNGFIKHTGEYFIEKNAEPNSYTVLQTADDTLKHLEEKIKEEEKVLERCEEIERQLEERINVLKGKGVLDQTNDLPKEIKSDHGVAVKVGEFYEIFEYEE